MLELAPRTESLLQEYAARTGVNADAVINRFLEQVMQPAPPLPFAQDMSSDDQKRAAVFAYIHAPAEEIARLHAPDIARLDAQLAEATNATPEEIASADAEWQAHKQSMNDMRRANGERLLYREETAQP